MFMTKPITPRTPASLVEPAINKGTAFTETERRMLGLTGWLSSAVLTLEAQAERLWAQLQRLPDDLARNLLLEQIHNRNEVLYFKVLAEHLTELLPVVYDPTVGDAIEQYSDEYRGQRGVYLSIDRPDDIETSFSTLGLGPDDVDIVVCSDAEQILGIGDWGVGGIEIASGKLAIYTAGGGIDPSRTIPVSLDVGTDNQTLLDDPFYLGNRHERRRGTDYDAFIARYVETVHRLFPKALLHFEDFGPEHAHTILTRYSPEYCVFNDDIQGTGAVVMAAIYSAADITGTALRDHRFVVFGAGTAGVGIANQLADAIVADGATPEQALAQIWLVDKQGPLFDDMDDLRDFQRPFAKRRTLLGADADAHVDLIDTIKMASPTVLLGTSTVRGAFTREVIEAMTAAHRAPSRASDLQPHLQGRGNARRRTGVVIRHRAGRRRNIRRASRIRRYDAYVRPGQQLPGVPGPRPRRQGRWCRQGHQGDARRCRARGRQPGRRQCRRRTNPAGRREPPRVVCGRCPSSVCSCDVRRRRHREA
jgi:malate dehydrogenase (oxaloacetate-decarboxylating)